jgi:predicted enzyme related to lactoylglutathione lyase
MSSVVNVLTFDCAAPLALARFWSAVTGWPLHEESGDEEAMVVAPEPRPSLLFVRVPEGKSAKNRIHFDLRPTDRTRDEEVVRLTGIGAVIHSDLRRPDGTGWVVLTDPEGNEFCVERSAAER